MIASCCRHTDSPQRAILTNNLCLLIDQINTMLEEAEERGIKQGQAKVIVELSDV